MRTYGLSGSGMDVDQLVKDLMKARRASYETMYKKKTQLEWKKADYNTMYSTIEVYKKSVFDNMKQATLMPKKVSSSNDALVSVVANADAANLNHTITVHQMADGVKKTSTAGISVGDKEKLTTQLGIAVGTFDITIKNGTASKTITVNTEDSIIDFVAQINSAGINVTANYDTTLDRFFLSTTNTGQAATIELTDNDLDAGAGTDFFLADRLKLNTATETGKDAIFALDGVGSTTDINDVNNLKMSSNTFEISKVKYTVKGTGTVTAMVSSDTEQVVANVKAFVDEYNKILEKISSEVNEAKYGSYLPLTNEEMADLKESQIMNWEEKAHSGLLRRDRILQELVTNMRSNLSSSISGLTGEYTSASSIGITTGDYTENGKLHLDEEKLKAALAEDPEIVYKIFKTSGETSSANGVAVRLEKTLTTSINKIKAEAGFSASVTNDTTSYLAKRIRDYNTRMSDMNSRLQDIEARYYKQFDALEKAMNKLSSQSTWLAQQFSS